MARRRRRRGFRGLSGGLGRLRLSGASQFWVPPAVATVVGGGTLLAIRGLIDPAPGTTGATLYRYAPLIGGAAGLLGALAMYVMGGKGAAIAAGVAAVGLGTVVFANETILASKGAVAVAAALPPPMGMGALMPEYSGMNGIVMQPVNGMGAMGDDVNLRGTVNQGAFGTSTFGGN